MFICRGNCKHLDEKGLLLHSGNHKSIKNTERLRCRICGYWLAPENYFILINGIRCPCCIGVMGFKPRNKQHKENLMVRIQRQKLVECNNLLF